MALTTGFKRKVDLEKANNYFTKVYPAVVSYFSKELEDGSSTFSRNSHDGMQVLFSAVRMAGDIYSAWIFGELKAQPKPNDVLAAAKAFVYMSGLPPEGRALFAKKMPANIRKLLDVTSSASKNDPLVIDIEDGSWSIHDPKFKLHQKELELYARTLLKVWRGDLGQFERKLGIKQDATMVFIVTANRWMAECMTDFLASIESKDYAEFIVKLKKYGTRPYVLSKFLVKLFEAG